MFLGGCRLVNSNLKRYSVVQTQPTFFETVQLRLRLHLGGTVCHHYEVEVNEVGRCNNSSGVEFQGTILRIILQCRDFVTSSCRVLHSSF